jgi:adenylosuccinate synthase
MLLDVLSGLQELKLCTAYDIDGERTAHFPSDSFQLERCRPVYEAIAGWNEDITTARKLSDLPTGARRYIDRIAEIVGLKVSVVSVGPDRAQTILV